MISNFLGVKSQKGAIGSWSIWKTPRTPITRFASIHVSRSVSPMVLVPCPASKNAPPTNKVLRRDTHHHHYTVFPFRETLVLHFNKYIYKKSSRSQQNEGSFSSFFVGGSYVCVSFSWMRDVFLVVYM